MLGLLFILFLASCFSPVEFQPSFSICYPYHTPIYSVQWRDLFLAACYRHPVDAMLLFWNKPRYPPLSKLKEPLFVPRFKISQCLPLPWLLPRRMSLDSACPEFRHWANVCVHGRKRTLPDGLSIVCTTFLIVEGFTFSSGCSSVRVPASEHSSGDENAIARAEEEGLAVSNAAVISERRCLLEHAGHSRAISYDMWRGHGLTSMKFSCVLSSLRQ